MSVLIVPCYIKSDWDVACLNRLLDSVREQDVPFDRVIDNSALSPEETVNWILEVCAASRESHRGTSLR